jgi:uncharacterized membrane protein YfcA
MLSGAIIGVATGRYLPKIVIAVFLFAILISVILKTKKSYTKVRNLEIERDNKLIYILLKLIVQLKENRGLKWFRTLVHLPINSNK